MTLTIALACAAALLALAVVAVHLAFRRGHPHRLRRVYGRGGDFAGRRGGASSRRAPPLESLRCRSACHGSARISASTRCRPSFSSWSISAPSAPACSRSATASTRRRRSACCRSMPAFLAGMTLVVLADDAFTFLLSWEFMSLTSWALVMSHHRVPENVHAGYVYLVMASFGTLALLLGLRPARRPRRALQLSTRCAPRIPSATIGALRA